MVGGGHAAIDRLLQDDFLDIVGRKTALRQCCAHMQAEFVPLAECDEGTDHQHAPRALVEMRPGPDIGPGVSRDQVDEIGIEGIYMDVLILVGFSAIMISGSLALFKRQL